MDLSSEGALPIDLWVQAEHKQPTPWKKNKGCKAIAPRLIAREQDLQNQMRHLGSKRFQFGQGLERMQINTELMKLRTQLSEVSKQLNRPVVWNK